MSSSLVGTGGDGSQQNRVLSSGSAGSCAPRTQAPLSMHCVLRPFYHLCPLRVPRSKVCSILLCQDTSSLSKMMPPAAEHSCTFLDPQHTTHLISLTAHAVNAITIPCSPLRKLRYRVVTALAQGLSCRFRAGFAHRVPFLDCCFQHMPQSLSPQRDTSL